MLNQALHCKKKKIIIYLHCLLNIAVAMVTGNCDIIDHYDFYE